MHAQLKLGCNYIIIYTLYIIYIGLNSLQEAVMKIIIKYSGSSRQDASNGIFNYPLSLRSNISIWGPGPWAIDLQFVSKLTNI